MACVAFGGNAVTLPQPGVRWSKRGSHGLERGLSRGHSLCQGPEAEVGRESLGSGPYTKCIVM